MISALFIRLLVLLLAFALNRHVASLYVLDDFRHETLDESSVPI